MDMSRGDNHGDGMTMTGGHGRPMMTSFYWGKATVILFSGWPGERTGMYVLCLSFIFFLAAALEILFITLDGNKGGTGAAGRRAAAQAVVYGIRMGVAYLVMLAVMSFNGGVFIAAVLGHALGFFIVRARAAVVANHSAASNPADGSDKP